VDCAGRLGHRDLSALSVESAGFLLTHCWDSRPALWRCRHTARGSGRGRGVSNSRDAGRPCRDPWPTSLAALLECPTNGIVLWVDATHGRGLACCLHAVLRLPRDCWEYVESRTVAPDIHLRDPGHWRGYFPHFAARIVLSRCSPRCAIDSHSTNRIRRGHLPAPHMQLPAGNSRFAAGHRSRRTAAARGERRLGVPASISYRIVIGGGVS